MIKKIAILKSVMIFFTICSNYLHFNDNKKRFNKDNSNRLIIKWCEMDVTASSFY